ncbi:Mitochondrial import inner membrane translocase subunit TIM22-2 [Zea mays]|jgi:hypothetical protein|uniref:Mitochondrial import inner membrane translocase subunit TIM22-2 n=1 Tax=Zea mays TaxID=4577 RepID=A0A1D6LF75_MAIZE|nr:Mitochondrial import inner membrane translocase subunit TIM22-2 [Zea mays]
MARGGGDRSREDDPFSDGGTTGTDSDESSPRGVGARGPGSTSNPILTRLAVSRNPSPLAAATAAPGVCLLRFAWESAAGSLVGAAVGYGKPTPPVVSAIPCLSVRMEPQPRARVYGSPMRGNVWLWRHFDDLRCGLGTMGLDSVRLRLCSPDSSVPICLISIVLLWTLFCCSPWGSQLFVPGLICSLLYSSGSALGTAYIFLVYNCTI